MRTESNEEIWRHFNAAFKKSDEAFSEADKAFDAANRAFDAMPDTEISGGIRTGKVHQLNFTASSWNVRLKLVRKFAKMAFAVLFTGKTVMSFKNK
jgi:hypothetical protein